MKSQEGSDGDAGELSRNGKLSVCMIEGEEEENEDDAFEGQVLGTGDLENFCWTHE